VATPWVPGGTLAHGHHCPTPSASIIRRT